MYQYCIIIIIIIPGIDGQMQDAGAHCLLILIPVQSQYRLHQYYTAVQAASESSSSGTSSPSPLQYLYAVH
jgi:hypothetical protein